jgi:hypothetical protein
MELAAAMFAKMVFKLCIDYRDCLVNMRITLMVLKELTLDQRIG